MLRMMCHAAHDVLHRAVLLCSVLVLSAPALPRIQLTFDAGSCGTIRPTLLLPTQPIIPSHNGLQSVTGKGEAFISGLVPERDDLGALLAD